MGIVGMLHYHEHPKDVKKAYPFAAVAKMEGIPFFYFSFNQIDFENMKIDGWVYENGAWCQKEFGIPEVIINSSNPQNQQQKEVINKLKQLAIFTSHPVGNKMKVYKKILRGKLFADYLIPSHQIHSPEDFSAFLNEQPKGVVKPLSGNRGKQVYFLENSGEKVKITDGSSVNILSRAEARNFITQCLKKRKFLFQPFIDCKTKTGLTYDFRLHVQKNGNGEWEINLIYPRISGTGKMVSNISSGGYRGEIESFLMEEFQESAGNVKAALEQFALSFSAHFDTLYDHKFDELGIDIGIDQTLKLWLFEVNWRPGCKNREFEVGRLLLPYCKYLCERK